MGTPTHYASELPNRLGFLIDALYPVVENGLCGDDQFGGALGTTFLLAMATPMVVLPMERILRVQSGKRTAADDNIRNPSLAKEIARIFAAGRSFETAPFAQLDGWSYVAGHPRFDIADQWPHGLLEQLKTPEAQAHIRAAETQQVLKDIRNALSHGGVTYLNFDGHHVYGDDVVMIAFAADESLNGPNYNVVRVTEIAFRVFLAKWATWLATS